MALDERRPMWQRAASLAARLHRHQTRKDGQTPYVAHPFRVAMTVRDLFDVNDPVALAAALLHDVIEDTTADYDDLAAEFGEEVARVVAALTKDMRLPEAGREPAYDEQLAAAPWQARLIKLADVYDNLCDLSKPHSRSETAAKAERAIALAAGDPRLAPAVERVRDLLRSLPAGP